MNSYHYPNSLARLLDQYDPFSKNCHQAEGSLALFVEKFSVGDYIFTPIGNGL